MNVSSIAIGPLHLPIFGIFAAAGLIAALLLGQRAARAVGLPPEKIWGAGMFAVLSAFLVSRLLLMAFNFATFRAEPVLVMAQPSLTFVGILITCLLTYAYLHWQRLPLLTVLDAAAPCAMVVWFALSLGHFVEGTNAGMPTRLPWGVRTPDDTMLGRVHPVEIYAALVAVWLCLRLLCLLPRRRYDGLVAARGLLAGGAASFLLGFLRQPVDTYGNSALEPAQSAALLLILIGGLLLALHSPLAQIPPQPTKEAAADAE